MKVLMINGSPHEKGCTFTALSAVAQELNKNGIETEIINIGNKPVRGCIGCKKCRELDGECVFNDDSVNETIKKLQAADGLVVGSPVYFSSPNGSLLSYLDRMFYARKDFDNKPAAAVISARRAGTVPAMDTISKYFQISNMPVVSSTYWNAVFGNTPEEVLQDTEGMQTMENIGKNMAWLIKSIAIAKENGLEPPRLDSTIRMNFIR